VLSAVRMATDWDWPLVVCHLGEIRGQGGPQCPGEYWWMSESLLVIVGKSLINLRNVHIGSCRMCASLRWIPKSALIFLESDFLSSLSPNLRVDFSIGFSPIF